MSHELRAALEAANKEYIDTNLDALKRGVVGEDFIPIFERHVRSWLKEQSGELREKIGAAVTETEATNTTYGTVKREGVIGIYERHLSPLFAALRVRAEEAEAKIAEIATRAHEWHLTWSACETESYMERGDERAAAKLLAEIAALREIGGAE